MKDEGWRVITSMSQVSEVESEATASTAPLAGHEASPRPSTPSTGDLEDPLSTEARVRYLAGPYHSPQDDATNGPPKSVS